MRQALVPNHVDGRDAVGAGWHSSNSLSTIITKNVVTSRLVTSDARQLGPECQSVAQSR